MPESNSLIFYNNSARAERYHQKKGFASERTARMHEVKLDLLTTLTAAQSTILELGAGTGLFTEKIIRTHHFREIYVTDGAPAMLQVAQKTLEAEQAHLHFIQLDFTTNWPGLLAGIGFDAIASSIALHHAADKHHLFQRIFAMLKPQGVFVLADHIAGNST
jgi:tRNA (cmo5U34)-methyltransferase